MMTNLLEEDHRGGLPPYAYPSVEREVEKWAVINVWPLPARREGEGGTEGGRVMSLPLGWRYRERNIRETGEAFVVPLYVMVPCVLCAFFISPPKGRRGNYFSLP